MKEMILRSLYSISCKQNMNINLAKEKIPFYKLKIFVFCFSITAVTIDREILIELFMSHLKTATIQNIYIIQMMMIKV
jgi:hypothetical protein